MPASWSHFRRTTLIFVVSPSFVLEPFEVETPFPCGHTHSRKLKAGSSSSSWRFCLPLPERRLSSSFVIFWARVTRWFESSKVVLQNSNLHFWCEAKSGNPSPLQTTQSHCSHQLQQALESSTCITKRIGLWLCDWSLDGKNSSWP